MRFTACAMTFASGLACDAEIWHSIGRLHQRLANLSAGNARLQNGAFDRSRPAPYLQQPGSPRAGPSCNADEAERWVMKGLACQPLHLDDEELLQATACDLRLFQLRPDLALEHVEQQLGRRESVMALANRAVCLHKLARPA